MQDKLSYLVDRSQPFTPEHVKLLDQLTMSMNSNSQEAREANQIWRLLKEDQYFWYRSHQVLEYSQVNQTKVFILVILESAIKQKWLVLPEPQRESLKAYIVNIVLEYGGEDNLPRPKQNILSKANSILVQIVKYQWNTSWTSFISDICNTSYKNMSVCENNFSILKMLSEEIFQYSKNQMTQNQINELKDRMGKDFETIYKLCDTIMINSNTVKPTLAKACLETLHAFLTWIPMYYVVCTDLIPKLIFMLGSDFLRNTSLSCLVEISSLEISPDNQDQVNRFSYMLKETTAELNKFLSLTTDENDIRRIQQNARKKWNTFQFFTRNIALFYSEFFKHQHKWLQIMTETEQNLVDVCRAGLRYLIMMMKIDDDQVFKICIQFFHMYIGAYLQKRALGEQYNNYSISNKNQLNTIYKEIFLQVMKIITLKMAKPQEVLIVIDEDGSPVRQEIENTENSSLYEVMKELATYLVRYDWPEMKKYILSQIQTQKVKENFSFDKLNSLSWIVGSLCGSMMEREQKNFFISTLRDLLQLCQNKKGKQPKAVIASCIMYVVGQYPTFLRNSWSFLKTVVKKLFQFMKEPYPGIMEMACNTFLKIVKSTADQFTINHNEPDPYIREIIKRIPEFTEKLTNDSLRFTFYEAVGYLIAAENDSGNQIQYMKETEGFFLFEFFQIIDGAGTNPQILLNEDVKRKILFFLRMNENVASGIGEQYILLFGQISEHINKIYMFYSTQVNNEVEKQGKNVLNYMTVKNMRSIKKHVIKIYIKYLQKCNNLDPQKSSYIIDNFIFPLGILLQDFANSIPETKEQQFVALFTVVLEKLNLALTPQFLSNLIELIFSSSLPLITTDFNSFPEIRANFFAFLKALIKYNFNVLYSLDAKHFEMILNCVIWSIRHQLSTYSDLGLDLLEQILNNVNTNPQIMNAFYPQYFLRILTDIMDVMTDGFHKSGLQLQTKVYFILIKIVSSNNIIAPISPDQSQNQSNQQFLYNFLVQKFSQAFPHTNSNVIVEKVNNWFNFNEQEFKIEVADFLVLINRYTQQEIKEAIKPTKQNQSQQFKQ